MIFFAAVCMTPYNINAAETTDIKASPAPTMRPEHYEEVAVTTEQQYMPELGCCLLYTSRVTDAKNKCMTVKTVDSCIRL